MPSSEAIHPKVFFSYSHDSPEHADRVLELSDRLRADGIDCILDQYEVSPPEGFPRWMDRQIKAADFVLMICTPTYYRRVMGEEEPGIGLGVAWESTLIYQYIYNAGTANARFIPVLLEGASPSDIPTPWQGVLHYRPTTEEGYEALYRRLTNQPLTPKGGLGTLRKLPPRERSHDFLKERPGEHTSPSLWNVPHERNAFFTGRESILTEALELFYSYAHKDEKLRNELNKHLYNLKRQGLIVEWYDRDINAGTDWKQAIDTHLNTANVILLLISPDFMASDYCYSIEMNHALERHKAGEARVIPIILKPVDWTDAPFSTLQVLPRNRKAITLWKERNAAFFEVANDIRETLKDLRKSFLTTQPSLSVQTQFALATSSHSIPLAPFLEEVQAQPVELSPVWNVPFPRNLRFTGREEILQQLYESFTRDTASSFKQPLALSGLGGMGKTQIALEYAYRHQEEYHVVLWAKADSQEVLTSELVSFATLLKVPGQHEQDQQYALAAVKHWLEVHSTWLLILDNIEDLTLVHAYLPTTPRGHLLLTTNSQVMHGIARRLDIDKMEPCCSCVALACLMRMLPLIVLWNKSA